MREELKTLMLHQFRPAGEGSLCEQFLGIKQEGTVTEYKRRFVTLATPVEGIPDDVLVSQFLNGLSPQIRAPERLGKVMELAQKIEEKNTILARMNSPKGS